MIQCIICEDWFHGTCLNVDKSVLESDDTGELICNQEKHGFTDLIFFKFKFSSFNSLFGDFIYVFECFFRYEYN